MGGGERSRGVKPTRLRPGAPFLLAALAGCGDPTVPPAPEPAADPSLAHARFDLAALGLPSWSEGVAINDSGQVAGVAMTADGGRRAFLWSAGSTTMLDTPAGGESWAFGLNLRGQVVGAASLSDGAFHAVLWDAGRITDLGHLGGGLSEATAISDRGHIVGYSLLPDGRFHAVLWEGGRAVDLTPDLSASAANSVNNHGHVVGLARFGLEVHAFLWQDGAVTDLGTLGGHFSEAFDINDRGQVVGRSDLDEIVEETGRPRRHPFLWSGSMQSLGTLGGANSYARSINELGQIVGGSTDRHGVSRPFVWDRGLMKDLGSADHPEAWAEGINGRGEIVGGTDRAVRWRRR